MPTANPLLARAEAFCAAYGLRVPILLAPMSGASPASLSIAVANAGGLGSCGALLMQPAAIKAWAAEVRAGSNGGFNLNLWIPDPPPNARRRGRGCRARLPARLGTGRRARGGRRLAPDFAAQCEAMLEVGPTIISSIMGLYPPAFVERMKAKGIKWFANATTVTEAKAAEAAGADVIVAQGMEAGGHRGAFDPAKAQTELVGLFALLPAIVDAVKVPVVATGGIADARGVAAALMLGASAAQIGTGFLRCPEAKLAPAWADAIGRTLPEQTLVTRAFSGRPGRSIATAYARAATATRCAEPAPYPVQRGLTQAMRDAGTREQRHRPHPGLVGPVGRLAMAKPAGDVVRELWSGAAGFQPASSA